MNERNDLICEGW